MSSSSPNLQNFSSRREDDYKRLLGPKYPFPTRAMFMAAPGHIWVKTDIKSAELLVVARLANDKNMIADVMQAMLPEDHPDYVDLHAKKAVEAFQLDCAPTKKALAAAGHKAKRVAAKNQLFGYLYGRGVVALCRQCREEGAAISEEEMQALVDATDRMYCGVAAYMKNAARRPVSPGRLTNPFGRHRRAGITDDRSIQGELERQFMNFGIQSTVADIVSTAMWRLYDFRRQYTGPHTFIFILQLHDELDFEVPVESLAWFVDEVLPQCICGISVPVTDFDGKPVPGIPDFHVDIDTSFYQYWGEPLSLEQGTAMGVPARFLGGSDD